MTIFQKMLFTPVLALTLFTLVTVYSYIEQQKSSEKIENFSKDYIPTLEIGNKNIMLFEQINQQIKDSIVSAELNWLESTQTSSQQLLDNFTFLSEYDHIVNAEVVNLMNENFIQYYNASIKLAKIAITNESILEIDNVLIEDVELFHKRSKLQFTQFNNDIKTRFLQEVQTTNQQVDNVLLTVSAISIISLSALLLITIYLSFSTRKSLRQVIRRMKQLSQGDTNFSNRLVHEKKDEMGYLIHWFNKLSDKLESNYLEIEKVSITDKLTQMNNRTRCDIYLPIAIENALQKQSHLCAVLLDIDHFKSINDTYGHNVGDEVLKQIAKILKSEVQSGDFIGRWGGEEFVIIVTGLAPERVFEKVDNLRKVIEAAEFAQVGQLTASFGISTFKADDTQLSLIERADVGLYKAKDNGRNTVVSDI